MFRWYQRSNVCYVYLADAAKSSEDAVEQIRKSRWITRGWTLQELLAPSNLRFYDRQWHFLGDKQSLAERLVEITGINFGAIHWPEAVSSYSVATRMYWASKRVTTRVEDQAYCMLGILGVNMPLLYGEGENAFQRLQAEVIKVSDDETIFAHSGQHLLAMSARDFSEGHALNVLQRSHTIPFTITNAGLHIHLRILGMPISGTLKVDTSFQRTKSWAILNCHHNTASNRNRYYGISLQHTAIENTYLKGRLPITLFDASSVDRAEYHTIFIRTKPAQVSRLTLLEQWDPALFSVRAVVAGSRFVYNGQHRELRIYPVSPFDHESTLHIVTKTGNMACETFAVLVFFDLILDRAGVMIITDYSDDFLKDFNDLQRGLYFRWRQNGSPAVEEVVTPPLSPTDLGQSIRIAVTRNKGYVWSLMLSRFDRNSQEWEHYEPEKLHSAAELSFCIGSEEARAAARVRAGADHSRRP